MLAIDDGAEVDIGGALMIWNTSSLRLGAGALTALDFEIASGGELQFGFAGSDAGDDFGRIQLGHDAVLGGSLQLSLLDGFLPVASDEFLVLDAANSVSGFFANVLPGERLATSNGSGSFRVDYGVESPFGATQIVLSNFAANSFTADFDADLDVDGDDNRLWQSVFGDNGGADADGDGLSSGVDLLHWQRQVATGAGGAARRSPVANSRAHTIPEPSALALVLLGFCALPRPDGRRAPSSRRRVKTEIEQWNKKNHANGGSEVTTIAPFQTRT